MNSILYKTGDRVRVGYIHLHNYIVERSTIHMEATVQFVDNDNEMVTVKTDNNFYLSLPQNMLEQL